MAALHKPRTQTGLCPHCAWLLQAQPARHSPCSCSRSLSRSLPRSPSQLNICITNRRKVSIFFPFSWLLLHSSVLPPSSRHYKHLLKSWEEVGKPTWVKTKKGGETINLINSSPWFPMRSHQYETQKRGVWCDMRSGDDGRVTPPPLLAAAPACAGIRLYCWPPAFIYVSNCSKLYP